MVIFHSYVSLPGRVRVEYGETQHHPAGTRASLGNLVDLVCTWRCSFQVGKPDLMVPKFDGRSSLFSSRKWWDFLYL